MTNETAKAAKTPQAEKFLDREISTKEREKESAMLGLLIAASDLQMHVFKDMQENLGAVEVDQGVVEFYEKKLSEAAEEFTSAYENLHKKEIITTEESK